MRRDGSQEQDQTATASRPRSLASAALYIGLVTASVAVGAVGTLVFLTHGSARPRVLVERAIDAGLELLSDDGGATVALGGNAASERMATTRQVPTPGASTPAAAARALPVAPPQVEALRPDEEVAHSDPYRPLAASRLPVPRSGPAESAVPPDGVAVLSEIPIGGRIVLPVKTNDVHPAYPHVARRARIGGVVVLEAIITAEGHVADVRIAASAPLLDDAAVAAVRRWQYEPARLNHRRVAVPVTINVAFSPR